MSLREDICNCIKTNSTRIYPFIVWYTGTEQKDRTEDNYNKSIKAQTQVSFDFALTQWLKRQDVQDAIKIVYKNNRTINMLKIYETMYNKALKGDVKSADWCAKFISSDFFENKSDEVNNFLNGVNIEGLNND